MSDADTGETLSVTLEFDDPESFERELRGLLEVVAQSHEALPNGDYFSRFGYVGVQAQTAINRKMIGEFFNHKSFVVRDKDVDLIRSPLP